MSFNVHLEIANSGSLIAEFLRFSKIQRVCFNRNYGTFTKPKMPDVATQTGLESWLRLVHFVAERKGIDLGKLVGIDMPKVSKETWHRDFFRKQGRPRSK